MRTRALTIAVAIALTAGLVACQPTGAGYDRRAQPYAVATVERGYRTVLGRAATTAERDRWIPRLVELGDATWLVTALVDGAEYRQGLGALGDTDWVDRAYRNATGAAPTADETSLWTAFLRSGGTRVAVLAWLVDSRPLPPLARPAAVEGCARFDRGGPRPACVQGGDGSQRAVAITLVPGTNIYVNRAWVASFTSFVRAARRQGFDLQGERDPNVPTWMLAPGSWRSWDDQQWLYTHIDPSTGRRYPANPPGRSMHEWGQAVDLTCNGGKLQEVPPCWRWVKANGPAHGVFLFHSVDDPTDSEAWHVSSNAR